MSGYRVIAMLVLLASMCGGGATCAYGASDGNILPGAVIFLIGTLIAGYTYNQGKKS